MNHISTILKILLIIIILPFLFLSFFPTPSADDYCFANNVLTNGFLQTQIKMYQTIGGRFFSIGTLTSVISILNLIGGKLFFIKGYWMNSLLILLALWYAFFILIKNLFSNQLSSKEIFWTSLGLFALFIARVPSTAQGFYWLSSSITYTLANIFTLILFALLLKPQNLSDLPKNKKIIYITICSFLTAAIVGSNETIMLILLIQLFFGSIYMIYHKHPNTPLWLISLIIGIIGAVIVFSAPGNSTRLDYFSEKLSLGNALVASLKASIIYILKWSRNITVIGASIFLLAFSSQNTHKFNSSKLQSRYLIIFIILWLVTIFMAFLPAFVAMGQRPPLRTRNTIFLIYMLGWFYIIFQLGLIITQEQFKKVSRQILSIGQIIIIIGFVLTGNFLRGAKDLTLAFNYKSQIQNRITQILKASENQTLNTITVGAYKNIPKTITFDDIEEDSTNWKNYCYSQFYSINSIKTTH